MIFVGGRGARELAAHGGAADIAEAGHVCVVDGRTGAVEDVEELSLGAPVDREPLVVLQELRAVIVGERAGREAAVAADLGRDAGEEAALGQGRHEGRKVAMRVRVDEARRDGQT